MTPWWVWLIVPFGLAALAWMLYGAVCALVVLHQAEPVTPLAERHRLGQVVSRIGRWFKGATTFVLGALFGVLLTPLSSARTTSELRDATHGVLMLCAATVLGVACIAGAYVAFASVRAARRLSPEQFRGRFRFMDSPGDLGFCVLMTSLAVVAALTVVSLTVSYATA
ncbi:MAG: hypothetical protein ACJ71T_12055 [Actinomycetales bacterium]